MLLLFVFWLALVPIKDYSYYYWFPVNAKDVNLNKKTVVNVGSKWRLARMNKKTYAIGYLEELDTNCSINEAGELLQKRQQGKGKIGKKPSEEKYLMQLSSYPLLKGLTTSKIIYTHNGMQDDMKRYLSKETLTEVYSRCLMTKYYEQRKKVEYRIKNIPGEGFFIAGFILMMIGTLMPVFYYFIITPMWNKIIMLWIWVKTGRM